MSKYPIYVMFYIDEDGKKKLEEICKADGRTQASMLRWLVNQEWDRLQRISTTQQSNNESVSIS